eukprot:6194427-Pleurochrysis_carterae.AAC.4
MLPFKRAHKLAYMKAHASTRSIQSPLKYLCRPQAIRHNSDCTALAGAPGADGADLVVGGVLPLRATPLRNGDRPAETSDLRAHLRPESRLDAPQLRKQPAPHTDSKRA